MDLVSPFYAWLSARRREVPREPGPLGNPDAYRRRDLVGPEQRSGWRPLTPYSFRQAVNNLRKRQGGA
jgi:hypothetical protein